jgi:hypothetical protein
VIRLRTHRELCVRQHPVQRDPRSATASRPGRRRRRGWACRLFYLGRGQPGVVEHMRCRVFDQGPPLGLAARMA